ncbi:S8 family serine peptidase [Sorangium sp. So ce394]|uniref:S8 family serine peptidase n=1 Tax=Sorangium sp. So ce394 TaxID=3133310 RepID=UPI003F5B5F0D
MDKRSITLVRSVQDTDLRAVCGYSNFGFVQYNTASLPDRLYSGLDAASRPQSFRIGEAELDVTLLPTPLEALLSTPAGEGDGLAQETRRAIARLEALWLLTEDRHRLLDAEAVEPLSHQASLVEHVLANESLRRVMIADEVGLGKTIEAGLIIRRLFENSASVTPRVLYLTEARLVDGVVEELERLRIRPRPRRWTTTAQEARLVPNDSDPMVVASIHRAVYQVKGGVNHFETVAQSGPWDVIIIDEAHHLSDWSQDGSDPQQRMRLVRKLVEERLTPGGRVLLLSGTPHQGHDARFRNLLQLLRTDAESDDDLRGRIIYRIKEDIRDWDNQPLFPLRSVRPPTRVKAPQAYAQWLQSVHQLLSVVVASRAGAWRRAQALQWCASSPHAGVAFLVRLALRARMSASGHAAVAAALAALRPYRGGPADEPLASLEARILAGRDELDEEDAADFHAQAGAVANVLQQGTALIQSDALAAKLQHLYSWLDGAPDEKFVVFAQPIETVYTLRERIEAKLGPGSVSLIVGGQRQDERNEEIRRFRDGDARVLVSSRSGGEGINLQVSRRLVHFDVPWNPMEMEQRVGRVHRYGSVDTVIVETLVLQGSREERVLDRARARLGQIIRDIDRSRFELLYSRTMALIPIGELAALMAGEAFGPLTPSDEERVDRLITEGYRQWEQTDASFRARSEALRSLDRGPVRDDDLERLLVDGLGARVEEGWQRRCLRKVPGKAEPELVREPARVLRLPDGSLGYVGRDAGLGLVGAERTMVRRLGLNDVWVADALRRAVGVTDPQAKEQRAFAKGIGSTLVAPAFWGDFAARAGAPALAAGGLLTAYCLRRLDVRGIQPREVDTSMRYFLTSASGEVDLPLEPAAAADLVRAIRAPRPKRSRPALLAADALRDREERRIEALRRIQPGDPVVAVFPLAAIWIEPVAETRYHVPRAASSAQPTRDRVEGDADEESAGAVGGRTRPPQGAESFPVTSDVRTYIVLPVASGAAPKDAQPVVTRIHRIQRRREEFAEEIEGILNRLGARNTLDVHDPDEVAAEFMAAEPDNGPKVHVTKLAAIHVLIARGPARALDSLATDPDVGAVIDADELVLEIPPPVDERVAPAVAAWHLSAVGAPDAHHAGITGANVWIGFADTGINVMHPELTGRSLLCAEFDASGVKVAETSGDAHGHGTHVAAIAAGRNVGVAPDARIAMARIFTSSSRRANAAQVLAGINWLATVARPDGELGVDLMCLSWCSTTASGEVYSAAYKTVIQSVRSLGVEVFAAIGNSGPGRHGSPGDYIETIGVGAIDRDGRPWSFSCGGIVAEEGGISKPDLLAPGVDVYSASSDGGYTVKTGTSMAAPAVAGVAALILQQRGKGVDLRQELRARARPIGDLPEEARLLRAHF